MTTAVTRIAFDANIFFYAIDERDPAKHRRCRDLLQNAIAVEIGVAPLQALGEFAYAAVRKDLLDRSEAALMARDWAIVFEVIAASPDASELALTWWRDERLSYWDALLVATVAKAGVTALLSEDMNDIKTRSAMILPPGSAPSRWTICGRKSATYRSVPPASTG